MADLPSRFGPYDILGPLGSGGMGQVFRGRDTRLQRLVAIKVLHDEAALDPDRQRRFAQEALAASALNHPNILTVYDVGTEDGTPYLVSELIDGESLRAEMNRGRVPLKRVVEIAHQIAEGLAAAHDAGIVHRDLKPENVMVTADGRVKIVDFGLAKAPLQGDALGSTHAATDTAAGLLVGTVPYMSPEQARGTPADFRSDQFSFGLMLHELATGSHPFKRETPVQTLSAIIADEPPDPGQATPPPPVALRWLLRRLLAKQPRQRFASTADLAADLRTLREHLAEATSGVGAAVPVVRDRPRWLRRAAIAAAIAATASVATQMFMSPDAAVRFDRFTPLATDAGYQGAPSWSPDGKAIAYEAEIDGVVQIFTRALGSPQRTQVTRSAFDCFGPMWSADGYIYYHSLARDSDALWRVSPVGGNPEMLIEGATTSTISPDGKTVFYLLDEVGSGFSQALWWATLPDVTPRQYERGLIDKARRMSSGRLRYSPDGSRILAWFGPDGSGDSGFWLLPTSDGDPRRVLPGLSGRDFVPSNLSWLPDNRHVVMTRSDGPTPGSHLWLAEPETGEMTPLTASPGNEGSPSVSPDGRTIAFTFEATDFDLFEIPLDGSPPRSFHSTTRNEFDPAASPVDSKFAYVTDRTGTPQIWLQNREGYLQQPLVTERDFDGAASLAVGSLAFSPDGTRLVFQRASSVAEGTLRGRLLWITSVSGGKPAPISGATIETGTYQDAPTWSPNGEWIAYLSGNAPGDITLEKAQVGSRAAPATLLKGIPAFVARPQWSPDGRWILCETQEGLTIVAADGTGSRQISDPGWFTYAWDRDGRRIYGLRATDDQHHFMLVSIDTRDGAHTVVNANLGSVPQAVQPIRGFSRLRDGGFLTSIAKVKSDIYLIEGFELARPWWRPAFAKATAGQAGQAR